MKKPLCSFPAMMVLLLMSLSLYAFSEVFQWDPGLYAFESKQVQGGDSAPLKEVPKPAFRQLVLARQGIQVKVPEKNWKTTEYDDETNPLELVHASGAIIQVLAFPTTMVNLAEIVEFLNRRYQNSLTADGAKSYRPSGEKDFKTARYAGKRAKSTFMRGREIYTLDQACLEGNERIVVMVLIAGKEAYPRVVKDFEALVASCEPMAAPSGEPVNQERKDVQDPGKGNGR